MSYDLGIKLRILYELVKNLPYIPEKPLSIAFSVNFNTFPGENVCVLGSIPEFGN